MLRSNGCRVRSSKGIGSGEMSKEVGAQIRPSWGSIAGWLGIRKKRARAAPG
jgi:hypothetical protein